MKFVVDAQLPPQLAVWLRAKGHDGVALRDIGLRDADDPDIWRYVEGADAIIVTKDEDFAVMARSLPNGPQVLWVRIGNTLNRELFRRFEVAWPQVEPLLAAGERVVELR